MTKISENKIVFETEDGTEEFFVEEQTMIGGTQYLLVSDSMDDEANAYILKDVSAEGEEDADYIMVEDPVEFDAVAGVFEKMMDDTEVTFE